MSWAGIVLSFCLRIYGFIQASAPLKLASRGNFHHLLKHLLFCLFPCCKCLEYFLFSFIFLVLKKKKGERKRGGGGGAGGVFVAVDCFHNQPLIQLDCLSYCYSISVFSSNYGKVKQLDNNGDTKLTILEESSEILSSWLGGLEYLPVPQQWFWTITDYYAQGNRRSVKTRCIRFNRCLLGRGSSTSSYCIWR